MPLAASYLDRVRTKPESTRHGLALLLAGVLTILILLGWLIFLRIDSTPAKVSESEQAGPVERLLAVVKTEAANIGRGVAEFKTLLNQSLNLN